MKKEGKKTLVGKGRLGDEGEEDRCGRQVEEERQEGRKESEKGMNTKEGR